jgi:hypothetical protein
MGGEFALALRGPVTLGLAGIAKTNVVNQPSGDLMDLDEGLRTRLIALYQFDEDEIEVKKTRPVRVLHKEAPVVHKVVTDEVSIKGLMGPSIEDGVNESNEEQTHADSMRLIARINEGDDGQVVTRSDALKPENPLPYAELIENISKEHGVSPALAAAVIKVESGFKPKARSRMGARGLMQLLPSTARKVGVHEDIYEPEHNIRGGVKYLKMMLDRYNGDQQLALAAYNAGPAAVDKHQKIPPYRETRDYVPRVLEYFREYVKYFSGI